jgi:prolyl oligopeptidase
MRLSAAVLLIASCHACACSSAPAVPSPPAVAAPPQPSVATAEAGPAGPPRAPIRPATQTLFGVTVTDPYAWMNQETSPEVEAWAKEQSEWARRALDGDPVRRGLVDLLGTHTRMPEIRTEAHLAGGKIFFSKSPDPDVKGSFVQFHDASALHGPVKYVPIAAPEARDDHPVWLGPWMPSPDGRRVVYAIIDTPGSGLGTLHVVEAATGKRLGDAVERAFTQSVRWRPDGRSFYYVRKPPGAGVGGWAGYLHTLGSDPARDPLVFGAGATAGMASPALGIFEGKGRFVIAAAPKGRFFSVYAAPRASVAGERTPWRKVVDADTDEVTAVEGVGDDLYLVTVREAPRGRVIRMSLARPDVAHAETVVPEQGGALVDLFGAADGLHVTMTEGGADRLVRVPAAGGAPVPVSLPLDGRIARVLTDPSVPGALVELSSPISPPTFYRVGGRGGFDVVEIDPWGPYDFSAGAVSRVNAQSADGTLVPMSILHRRHLARDGSHPALLEALAAFGRIDEPHYDSKRLAWLERGGVHAFCHARGGGEFGEPWHRAGSGLAKHRSVEDFIACAEKLVAEGFTSAKRLGAGARAFGAVTVAAAAVERPELFGAVYLRDGVFDLVGQKQHVTSSPGIPNAQEAAAVEFGDLRSEEGLRAMLAVDAYHAIKPGTRYPAFFFALSPGAGRAGALKMAARLLAAREDAAPVLVALDAPVVKGDAPSRAVASAADLYTFLFARLARP